MRNSWLFFIGVLGLSLLAGVRPAHAVCINPDGDAGEIKFNKDFQVMQYCDDTAWQQIGPTLRSSDTKGCPNIGDLCSDGTIFAGEIDYGLGSERLYVRDRNSGSSEWKNGGGGVDDIIPDSNIDGRANRRNMVSYNPTIFDAFEACEGLSANGYNDWYLPARDESVLLASNASAINASAQENFVLGWNWASTEVGTGSGTLVSFNSGAVASTGKAGNYPVRCVRREGSKLTSIVPNGLVARWKLDETSGTTAIDSSGSGNDGTMNDGLSAGANGINGRVKNGLSFDGVNDDITIPDDNTLDVGTADFTVSTWFKSTSSKTQQTVVGKGRSGSNGIRYMLSYRDNDCNATESRIKFEIDDNATKYFRCSSVIDAAEWNLATMAREGNTISTYINGKLNGVLDVSGAGSLDNSGAFL